ncbi:Glutamyl-tRNA(Gln) amidotransferase subunit F, mitochondrial [Nakaseomyces bracarensis]|uniref:Glutamyl-tRNA(Gln) amidotransferase subunit F, mitochondrial n=1 Tax=Nakaseomyces bracarensis TaxID=273131 RepID=A0ABR4NR99_9SACH
MLAARRLHIRGIRCYSVGSSFKTIEQVKQYLSQPTWSITEMLDSQMPSSDVSGSMPSDAEVKQLLALSGFPVKGTNIENIKQKLIRQLSFINTLHNTPLNENDKNLSENYARLLPRQNIALSYDDLLHKIENVSPDQETGEVFDSWDATSMSQISKDNYFVVRQGLLRDRK